MNRLPCRFKPTNTVILDSEAREIRERLSDAETDLVNLNHRIALVQVTLNELLGERTELTTEITGYRISLAPHKKLPPELLTKIFEYCVPDQVCLPLTQLEAPLLLCQICSYWRRVAFGTATLWNDITLDFCTQMHPVELLATAEAWLARSGQSALLSIKIVNSFLSCRAQEKWGLNVVERLITPNINRLRKIVVKLTKSFVRTLLRLPAHSAQALEVLDINSIDGFTRTGDDQNATEALQSAVTILSSAPRLRSAVFESGDYVADSRLADLNLLCLPFAQLTDLQYVSFYLSPDCCHNILRQCPNLVRCTISVTEHETFADLRPTILPNLQQLKLIFVCDLTSGVFFRPLVLPALEDFAFESPLWQWPSSVFASLSSRSSFDLKKFALLNTQISAPDLEELLRGTPSLVELDLGEGAPLSSSTLQMISNGDLIPKLEVIRIDANQLNAVLDMIQSRWALDVDPTTIVNSNGILVSRLRRALLIMQRKIKGRERARLDMLREGGLQIRIVGCL